MLSFIILTILQSYNNNKNNYNNHFNSGGDNLKRMNYITNRIIPFLCGILMSINFVVFWLIPIMGMGAIYKQCLKPYLQPLYLMMDKNYYLRLFASNYIYTKPEHADFISMSILLIINCSISIPTMFYTQLKYGYLPWWLIFCYYCSWVGIGGSMMGSAYGLAHKEGHYYGLYKKWLRDYIGHFFENWIGLFWGNVPWNFTTSHVYIHHRLDGGIGDTFYEWDIDRTSLYDFMFYVHRIFMHMIGYSSIKFFLANGLKSKSDQLIWGIVIYWSVILVILTMTRSLLFVFWLMIQPLLCMTYFLALINIGFHGFLEFDENGHHIPTVNSTTIIDGEDDLFGEDDHMAHHYHTNVYFRNLSEHQKSKIDDFKRTKASIFQKISIVELSIFILLNLWDKVADHYVDYSGKLSRQEIIELLVKRLKLQETSFDHYQKYLNSPTIEARKQLIHQSKSFLTTTTTTTDTTSTDTTTASIDSDDSNSNDSSSDGSTDDNIVASEIITTAIHSRTESVIAVVTTQDRGVFN